MRVVDNVVFSNIDTSRYQVVTEFSK